MMSLTGMAGYCRAWLPDYAEVVQLLADLIYGHKMAMSDKIKWTPEGLTALTKLKQLMTTSPCLGLPDHSKPLNLFVCERNGFMSSVLTQEHGGKQCPVGYYSKQLDSVARGLVCCLRAVAAATCADIVAMCELTVHVPHAVHALISQAKTAHLTPARLLHYQNVLLTMCHVTLKRCTVLNPATLLPTDDDGEPHDCAELLELVSKPRSDLTDVPLQNAHLELFVDGSAQRSEKGEPLVAYVVTTASTTLESAKLPSQLSAQAAELFALTRACILAKGQSATIYTDSRYAFGVVHDFGTLWKQRGFLTSSG
ncbi:uncharacterized protein LOC112217899 isoform X2 [Oncorhynchus tshawytscha]|uniref:uncharacterized protein LOC112217899 isoform X2 n=1 Tax=Oncorhynchus tshawytscha TaxID=74940 RepID=UPI000D09C89E|nr:uncharacterized protein LOC112217899 isoform X2 [Oncorhynchus tshawytscha]